MRNLSTLLFQLLFAASTLALWPMPTHFQTGNSTLILDKGFQIQFRGGNAPSDLQDAISRTNGFLKNDKLGRLVVGRGSSDAPFFRSAKSLRHLVLSLTSSSINSISAEATKELTTRDESYELVIPSDGSDATLKANTTLGLFRGLTSFSQLWYTYQGTIYAFDTPMDIKDSPAYPYRGLLLDTSRNFFPVDDIKRTLDAMSWVKMNTLHWHVVDSQSFPIEVPAHPELSQKGAYSDEMTYSPSQVKDLIAYAAARGIDILPEFDTPGHTSAISESHPEHIACAPGSSPYDGTVANEPPSGQLRFAVSATQTFTLSVLKSFSSLFSSKMFSTGGDELNTKCYQNDPQTQAALQGSGKTLEQALSDFTVAEHSLLAGQGKTAVVWEEMVLAHNVTLRNDTIVMVWISSADAAAVAAKGFRIVHSPSDYFYLDCGGGGWLGNNPPGNSWCDPFKTWQKAYSFDPLANLTGSQGSLILGGQQLLWTEQSGPENLDPIVWPRAAASAEVFWTGAGRPSVKDALARLHDVRYRFVQRGIKAINLQPLWCALRPGQCDLQ